MAFRSESESERLGSARPPAAQFETCNAAVADHARLGRNHQGLRKVVLHFTPSWFSVNMGTGIVSILLHNLPYNASWLQWISIGIFALNVALFVLFFLISILRYTMFRGVWSCMIKHPVQSLFLGTFPMGLATIINMTVFVCVPAWGDRAATLAWVLWWIDVACAVGTNFYLPFVIMHKHESALLKMTAVWLLPVVATIVASASGSIVASVLGPTAALITIITSYILWGCGVPLALFILVIYFQRLTFHSLPARELIVSVFLPLGPLGQGSFAIMQLGKQALQLFPITGTVPAVPAAGQILYVNGLVTALVLWGFALIWLFFALASISRGRFPFNLGWWGFTFPLGVLSVSTTTLAVELPSILFKVLGTIFSLVVVVLWLIVTIGTVHQATTRNLIYAPCVEEWEAKQKSRSEDNRPNVSV